MEILKRHLSKETQNIVKMIRSDLSKPVEFHDILQHPISRDYGYISASDNKYDVYIDTKLPQDPFEVNIIHELLHALQCETNFPRVCHKNGNIIVEQYADMIPVLGASLSSCIADLDVQVTLDSLKRSYDYFNKERIDDLCNLQTIPVPLDNRYAVAHFSLNHTLLFLSCTKAQQEVIMRKIAALSLEVHKVVSDLIEIIMTTTYVDKRHIAVCYGKIISYLNLWNVFCIDYNGKYLRTTREFEQELFDDK